MEAREKERVALEAERKRAAAAKALGLDHLPPSLKQGGDDGDGDGDGDGEDKEAIEGGSDSDSDDGGGSDGGGNDGKDDAGGDGSPAHVAVEDPANARGALVVAEDAAAAPGPSAATGNVWTSCEDASGNTCVAKMHIYLYHITKPTCVCAPLLKRTHVFHALLG